MDVDPVASMRCWAIVLELGGREFEIPARPAADWWPVLASGDLFAILDFVVSSSDDPDSLDSMLLDGRTGTEELTQALLDTVEEISGRAPQAAIMLAMAGEMAWAMVGGHLAQTGFRWDKQPIGAALDAVYSIIVSALEKEPREKFLAALSKTELGRIDREKALSDFEAIAGPRPAPRPRPGRSTAEPSGDAPPRTPRPPRQLRRAARSSAPRQKP